ncbi:MAG: family 20 glycosylhydrolase [Bacteroidetes bacterium]|nr:family 20 glycosylhydrolase [Bacteroidota bacterium]
MNKFCFFLFLLFTLSGSLPGQPNMLMPVPQKIISGKGEFRFTGGFRIFVNQPTGSRAGAGVSRFIRRLDNKTHLLLVKEWLTKKPEQQKEMLTITCNTVAKLLPGENESYLLKITPEGCELTAPTDIGILHGLETFLQLIESDTKGYFIRSVTIDDAPRFTWRGLLIDVARHFSPVDVIKRNIDGLAMMKMNVLHLHLTEDQGFRIESKVFPKLHQYGSDGDFFTQEEMRSLIQYANVRGIRVVPEFDMPGHATSWFVGHPELASGPGPYTIEKKFGVFDPTIDPTRKETYVFLEKFLTEMCELFPDPWIHIGGDENNGKQWDANPKIQEFMKKNGLKDNHALQNYFNTKVMAILKKNKKKMIGWDEVLQPGLPADAVIQSWRGKEGLEAAAKNGHQVILSNGYYIDLSNPAWKHYTNDPLPANNNLSPDEQKNILGGEATMWAELVTPENIDSRIWPRTAAIAERLWSDREVNNIPSMYSRLARTSIRLEECGLEHITYRAKMIRRLAGNRNIESLITIAGLVEPLKDYKRHAQGVAYSTDLPFTRLPDIAAADAPVPLAFKDLCETWFRKKDPDVIPAIRAQLEEWQPLHGEVQISASGIPALAPWLIVSERVSKLSKIGLESLHYVESRAPVPDAWVKESYTTLSEAALPVQECELMIAESVMMLFQNALPK